VPVTKVEQLAKDRINNDHQDKLLKNNKDYIAEIDMKKNLFPQDAAIFGKPNILVNP